jgi:hypothetical protein
MDGTANFAACDGTTKALMLSFESLGERCDFGAVQRTFGVEPLGLLRFAFTRFDALIAALEDRFAAVGTAEDTGFELYGDENIVRMKKYGIIFHTFVNQRDLPSQEMQESFRRQQLRRLAFLRDKLIADLEHPQKICIHASEERVSDADMERMFAALGAYGPNSLLYVRPHDSAHPLGSVEKLRDGLFAGYFAGHADFIRGEQPPFPMWHGMCEQVRRLSQVTSSKVLPGEYP